MAAINPETGEILVQGDDGAWVKPKMAQNPKTGEKLFLDGGEWKPVPSPKISTAEKVARTAEFGARGFVDSALETVGGIGDLGTAAMRALGLTNQDPRYFRDALKSGFYSAAKAIPHPVVGGPQEATGALEKGAYGAGRGAADAASIMVPAAAVGKLAKAGSVTQNVAKTLASQPVMQTAAGMAGGAVGEATDNPYLGAAAALAVPAVTGAARRMITPRTNLSGEAKRLAGVLEREGVPIRASQLSGSKAVQNMDSAAGELPFSAGMKTADVKAQKRAFNAAVLKTAGIQSDVATTNVLESAYEDFGRRFSSLADQTYVPVTKNLSDKLDDIWKSYSGKIGANQKGILKSYIDDIKKLKVLSGEQYNFARSDISKSAFEKAGKDNKLSDGLHELAKTLDDAIEGGIKTPELKADWRELRRQYSNYAKIRDAMTAGTDEVLEGNIPAGRLLNSVMRSQKGGYVRGAGELNDLARAGKRFIPEKTANSGTAQRMVNSLMLQGPFAGFGVMTGNPAMVAASAAAPPAVYKALNSPMAAAYFKNNLLPYAPQMTKGLVGSALAARFKDYVGRGLLDD